VPPPPATILTRATRPITATVQLTYMAQGFDWSVNYVGRLRPEGDAIALFAWLTVANGGQQNFREARLQVVAGKPSKRENNPPPPPPAPAMEMASPVAVVGSAQANVEALGDLKLYRVPMRVTVAAQAQKQVAMLVQPAAAFERVYLVDLTGGATPAGATRTAPFELRARNVVKEGLGVPLPAGTVALFARGAGRDLYAGEAPIDDRAVGEDVALRFGDSPDVSWALMRVAEARNREQWRVDIFNARGSAIRTEVLLPFGIEEKPPGARREERGWTLPVDVAPNGTISVTYATRR